MRASRSRQGEFFPVGVQADWEDNASESIVPDAFWIDLPKAEEYRRYLHNPEFLREELSARPSIRQVVLDEVQKVHALVDEVHWIMENRGTKFALCGSSARKVKHGQANLLGGRAVRYEFHGLTATVIGDESNTCGNEKSVDAEGGCRRKV